MAGQPSIQDKARATAVRPTIARIPLGHQARTRGPRGQIERLRLMSPVKMAGRIAPHLGDLDQKRRWNISSVGAG